MSRVVTIGVGKSMPIRNHFIPEYYLKNFCDNNGKIWVFDRKKNHKIMTEVHAIGCEKDLYTNEMEEGLANKLEFPMRFVFQALLDHEKITDEQKFRFSEYINVFQKRTPAFKDRIHKYKEYHEISHTGYKDIINKFSTTKEQIDNTYQNLDDRIIWESIIEPSSSFEVVYSIFQMTWIVYTTCAPSFITSDNPVFVPTKTGIVGTPFTEFSFPISSTSVLVGSWEQNCPFYQQASERIVLEINNRSRKLYRRFLYAFDDLAWLEKPIRKNQDYSRISRVRKPDDAKPEYLTTRLEIGK